MRKFFYLLLITSCYISENVWAQTIRTDVLVIGGNEFGIAAGIQAAKSGVKAYLIDEATSLGGGNSGKNSTGKSIYDSLKKVTDTTKNLKVAVNTKIKSRERSGNRWKVKLANGTQINAKVIVESLDDRTKVSGTANTYANNLYRTLVGFQPLKSFVAADAENLVKTSDEKNAANGQAAGAAAAYCAFFGTTTKKLDVRVIQGEILGYKGELLKITDIPQADSNYKAIQRIAVTGILKADVQNAGGYSFRPEEKVKIEDIASVREYFTRSQLWFKDNPSGELTLEKLLSLIKFTGNRGEELNREVEKGWKTSFKFSDNFDLKKQLTRRQTAALIDAYLKPFNTKVDLDGRILN